MPRIIQVIPLPDSGIIENVLGLDEFGTLWVLINTRRPGKAPYWQLYLSNNKRRIPEQDSVEPQEVSMRQQGIST